MSSSFFGLAMEPALDAEGLPDPALLSASLRLTRGTRGQNKDTLLALLATRRDRSKP
jgi:hypothetical protein